MTMPRTIPQHGRRSRHLAAVPDPLPGPPPTAPPSAQLRAPKPAISPHARLDVEQARQFVMELDLMTAGVDPLRSMFLLGRCVEHAQALLDVLDAVVALGAHETASPSPPSPDPAPP